MGIASLVFGALGAVIILGSFLRSAWLYVTQPEPELLPGESILHQESASHWVRGRMFLTNQRLIWLRHPRIQMMGVADFTAFLHEISTAEVVPIGITRTAGRLRVESTTTRPIEFAFGLGRGSADLVSANAWRDLILRYRDKAEGQPDSGMTNG